MAVCPGCGGIVPEGTPFCGTCGAAIPEAEGPAGRSPESDPLIGRTLLGQYVIKQRLGEGGMGTVYLADQPSMGRKAVIKLLHAHFVADPRWTRRFHREAQVASKLTHPNCITLYNFGRTDDGLLYIAMEYVEGQPLSSVIEREAPLPAELVVDLAVQICGALEEAHQLGIIHRDLKPDNVLITRRGGKEHFAKILDFGIAKMRGPAPDEAQLTATGVIFGTPAYMSPEQFCGEELDGRSDLYSLGVMLYEMATGRRPFNASTPVAYFRMHQEEPVPPMRQTNPDVKVPPGVEAVILRCLEKDPARRPKSAAALAAEIQEALRSGAAAGFAAGGEGEEWADSGTAAEGEGLAGLTFLDRLERGEAGVHLDFPRPTPEPESSLSGPAPPPARVFSPPVPAGMEGDEGVLVVEPPREVDLSPAAVPSGPRHPSPPGALPPSPAAPTSGPFPAGGTLGVRGEVGRSDGDELQLAFDPRQGRTRAFPEPAPPLRRSSSLRSPPMTSRGGTAALQRKGASVPSSGKGRRRALLGLLALAAAGGGVFYAVGPGARAPGGGGGAVSGAGGATTPEAEAPMVDIPGGRIRLGRSGDPGRPGKVVEVRPFRLDRHEVTNAQYDRCVAAGECTEAGFSRDARLNAADRPVVGVSWFDAERYCRFAGKRLPREAEWELAARGNLDERRWPWGDVFAPSNANVMGNDDGFDSTAPVESFPGGRSPFGVSDMAGNVAEWVADWFDPTGGTHRVVRGGSYLSVPDNTTVTSREGMPPGTRDFRIGFRCAKEL